MMIAAVRIMKESSAPTFQVVGRRNRQRTDELERGIERSALKETLQPRGLHLRRSLVRVLDYNEPRTPLSALQCGLALCEDAQPIAHVFQRLGIEVIGAKGKIDLEVAVRAGRVSGRCKVRGRRTSIYSAPALDGRRAAWV